MGFWGAIKKSINSDLNTPLNSLISGVQSTVIAISNVVATININTARRAVKNVQRGVVTCSDDTSTTVTISAVNPSKSTVLINGAYRVYSTMPGCVPAYTSLGSTTLIISSSMSNAGSGSNGRVSWQIEEAY